MSVDRARPLSEFVARRIWRLNQEFWKDKSLRPRQEIVFASTGVKKPTDRPDKYMEALLAATSRLIRRRATRPDSVWTNNTVARRTR